MRIQVTLDSSAGALTIHAEGYSTATPPARLAVTLASMVEAALTKPAPPAQLFPADQEPAPALTTRPTVEAPGVQPAATTLEASEAPAAEVVVAPDVPADNSGRDEQLRRTALQLLNDGHTDDQVCQQLGISRSRLLRWDDPDGEFLAPPTGTLAAVSA